MELMGDLSGGWLLASLVVSTVGFGFFRYGKKQERLPQLVAGLAMMVYPMFVSSALWMLAIAGALVGGVYAATRAGV